MSDNIPFEIQREIMQRLPVKSLIQFRSVSKTWKSLIDNPKFIVDYHTRGRGHNHHLLVRYVNPRESIFDNFAIIVDDDSFPQHKIPMTLPMSVSSTTTSQIRFLSTTISQGLVCFCITYGNHNDSLRNIVVLWNPAIRKSVVLPIVLFSSSLTFIGFGVSPHTNDPMLVKITYMNSVNSDYILSHVEVFTLSTGVWRSLCTNLPRKSIRLSWDHVAIDRFIYWTCIDWRDVVGGGRKRKMIMSFDMISEKFEEISLPDCLTHLELCMLDIFKLKESLVVLETDKYAEIQEYVVWIMEHGVPKSFRKLYTIKALDASIQKVFGFRKSGEPIIDRLCNVGGRHVTSVYDPSSQSFNDIVIIKNARICSVSSYTETLLLLDH